MNKRRCVNRLFSFTAVVFAVMFLLHYQVEAKTSVSLNKNAVTIYAGNSFQLKAVIKGTSARVRWSSSNKKIATVNSSGRVTAKKAGKVKIYAKVSNVKKICTVTVKPNVKDISKVYNKSLSSAVSALGFKHVTKMDKNSKLYTGYNKYVNSTTMYYTATGSYSSSKTHIVGESYYKNSPGKFTAHLRDKTLSAFGVKVGMSPSSSHKMLKKSGWNLLFDGIAYNGALAKTSRMYSKSNGSIINLAFKSGKVYDITYQWRMASEF